MQKNFIFNYLMSYLINEVIVTKADNKLNRLRISLINGKRV